MILRAENILGGCMLSVHYNDDPDAHTDGLAVLTSNETWLFCAAIEKGLSYEKNGELSLNWHTEGQHGVLLVQASKCDASRTSLLLLRTHLMKRQGNTRWQLGAQA
jgi:hypothetical protein